MPIKREKLRPRIALFSDKTALTSFRRVLPRMFEDAEIEEITAADLQDHSRVTQFNMIVLPGIASETSHYPEVLSGDALENIQEAIRSGSILWASCAAAYYMAQSIYYVSSTGNELSRSGLGMIPAAAHGPVDLQEAIAPDTDNRFADVRTIPVTATLPNGETEQDIKGSLGYGNGPAFKPVGNNGFTQIVAKYDNGDIAIAHYKYGDGLITVTGPLVELGAEDAQGSELPDAHRIYTALEGQNEAFRIQLCNSLRYRWRSHMRRRNQCLQAAA